MAARIYLPNEWAWDPKASVLTAAAVFSKSDRYLATRMEASVSSTLSSFFMTERECAFLVGGLMLEVFASRAGKGFSCLRRLPFSEILNA